MITGFQELNAWPKATGSDCRCIFFLSILCWTVLLLKSQLTNKVICLNILSWHETVHCHLKTLIIIIDDLWSLYSQVFTITRSKSSCCNHLFLKFDSWDLYNQTVQHQIYLFSALIFLCLCNDNYLLRTSNLHSHGI